MTNAEKILAYEVYYIERFKNKVAISENALAVARDILLVALEQQRSGEIITGRRKK